MVSKPIVCKYCGEKYSSSVKLRLHLYTSIHEDIPFEERKAYAHKVSPLTSQKRRKPKSMKVKLTKSNFKRFKELHLERCRSEGKSQKYLEQVKQSSSVKQLRKVMQDEALSNIESNKKGGGIFISTPMGGQSKYRRR